MKSILFFILVTLIGFTSVSARIGETRDECEARYGKPLRIKPGDQDYIFFLPLGISQTDLCFQKAGVRVAVSFIDEKVGRIAFAKTDGLRMGSSEMDAEEIKLLLKANGGGQEWIAGGAQSRLRMSWTTADSAISATYVMNVLQIQTAAYTKAAKERAATQQKALREAEVRRLDGF